MAVSPILTEADAVAGPAVFAEWLLAHGLHPGGTAERLAAVAGFAGLRPSLGWAGNLRRRDGTRVAIRREARHWTFAELRADDAAWREAAGPHAEGDYATLVRVVADHLLRADTRPDDVLVWSGDPADPWPFGALIVGATLVFRPPPSHRGGP